MQFMIDHRQANALSIQNQAWDSPRRVPPSHNPPGADMAFTVLNYKSLLELGQEIKLKKA